MRSTIRWATFGTTVLLASAPSLGTDVGGLVCSDTTWSAAGSPYVATGSVLVSCGATLTIEPGVEVRFRTGLDLTVGDNAIGSGTLVARGTQEMPILFTSNDPYENLPGTADPGDWSYIHFTDYATDAAIDPGDNYLSGCILEHVIVEYAGSGHYGAVFAEQSSPFLSHGEVRHNLYHGIYVDGTSAAGTSIDHCQVWDNPQRGVYISAGSYHKLRYNDVHDNHDGGIFFSNAAGNTLTGNTITANTTEGNGGGLRFLSSGGNTLTGNAITGNTASLNGGGIRFTSSGSNTLTGNTITGNIASAGGGIYWYASGGNMLTGNTIAGNTASSGGGGMNCSSGSSRNTLTDNTITDNTASVTGGGIVFRDSSGSNTLTGNTLTDNTAGQNGGAIYCGASSNNTLTANVITANETNTGSTGGIYVTGDSQNFSLKGDEQSGTYNVIAGNEGYQVYNNNALRADGLNDIDARYAYWCTDDINVIQEGIYDYFDDATKAYVIWSPFVPTSGNDCNENGFSDECDISLGTSADCNSNGTPDECESAPGGTAVPGDYLIISRTFGTIYAIDSASGAIRSLISGYELRDPCVLNRGAGDSLANSYQSDLLTFPDGRLLARFDGDLQWGLYWIDIASGDRVLLPGTDGPEWTESGAVLFFDEGTLLAAADQFASYAGGMVLKYDLTTGVTTVLSGPMRGDGPLLDKPRGLALWDADTALAVEFNPYADATGLYFVELTTGDRSFLSRLSCHPFDRPLILGGVPAGTVTLGDDEGGSGPVGNSVSRSVAVVNGRIIVGITTQRPNSSYTGGLLEIDPATGDRTLLIGEAYVDDGTCSHLIVVPPSNPQGLDFCSSAIGLQSLGHGGVLFTGVFDYRIYEYNLNTAEFYVLSDLQAQVPSPYGSLFGPTGLAVHVPPDCNSNALLDTTDIRLGRSADCNGNDVPDECEIAGGTSPDCNGNAVPDECDLAGGTSLDGDTNGVPDECEPPRWIGAVPVDQSSLCRSGYNVMRLTFSADISTPSPGQVEIRQLLDNGGFGPDLSTNGFTFTVEDVGEVIAPPRVLKIQENASVVAHRTWYVIRNLGGVDGWAGVAPFEVQYVVQVGDVNGDGKVLANDLSAIFPKIPTNPAGDQERADVNGDGKVLANDLSVVFPRIPSNTVPKPSGH